MKKSWSFGLTVISFYSSPPKAKKRNEFLIVTVRLQNVQFTFMVGQPTERKLKQDWFQNGFIDCAESGKAMVLYVQLSTNCGLDHCCTNYFFIVTKAYSTVG